MSGSAQFSDRPPGGRAPKPLRIARAAFRRFGQLSSVIGPVSAARCMAGPGIAGERMSVRVKGFADPFYVRPRDSDSWVMCQVFSDLECELPPEIADLEPRVILDGGANAGFSTRYFAEKNPDAVVLAVEPDANNAEMIGLNTKPVADRVRLFRGGLWSSDGHVRVSNHGASSWQLQFEPAEADDPSAVECWAVPTIMERAGVEHIDVVKLDIEGAEEQVFRDGDLGWLERVRALVIETHGETADAVVREAMSSRGFQLGRQGEKLVAWR